MMVLANLLLPEDFGLVALGLILVNFLIIFREFGLGSALIQRQTDLDEAYSTSLILFPLVGFVLYIVAFFAAPLASQFFHQEKAVPLIRWMAFSIPIAGLGILPSTLIQKNLAFHRKLVPEWLAAFGYGVIAIVLAGKGFGAFSMVYGQIASETIRSVCYWIICPFRFRWCPSFKVVRELLLFGQKVTAGTLSLYVFNNMDQFSIGKLLGDAALGFYSFAFRVANFPTVNITHMINQVLLPAYSQMQSDRSRFRRNYLRATGLIAALTIPLAVGFVFYGRDGLESLYGTKWLPAVGTLQILAIYGMVRSVGATFGNVLVVSARPEWIFYAAAGQIVMVIFAVVLGAAKYGIAGIAVMMTSTLILGVVFNGLNISRILGLAALDWIRTIGVPLLLSLLTIGGAKVVFSRAPSSWLLTELVSALVFYSMVAFFTYQRDIRVLVEEIRTISIPK
jgi:O-antigen/teichoic acid export membrane protein